MVDLKPAAGLIESTIGHVDGNLAVAYPPADGKAEFVVWIAVVKDAYRQIVFDLQDGIFTDVLLEEEGRIGDGRKALKIVRFGVEERCI